MHQKGASSAVKAPGLLLFASTPDPEGYSGAAFCINGIALGLPLRCKKQQAASLRAMGSELKAAKGPVKASRQAGATGALPLFWESGSLRTSPALPGGNEVRPVGRITTASFPESVLAFWSATKSDRRVLFVFLACWFKSKR